MALSTWLTPTHNGIGLSLVLINQIPRQLILNKLSFIQQDEEMICCDEFDLRKEPFRRVTMTYKAVNFKDKFSKFTEHWSPGHCRNE